MRHSDVQRTIWFALIVGTLTILMLWISTSERPVNSNALIVEKPSTTTPTNK